MKKLLSIVTGCYNEVENIPIFYNRCRKAVTEYADMYDYEFVVADNCSTDGTRDVLRKIATEDPNFRVIMNANNFGHIRSPFNAVNSSRGDVVFCLCSDLQEPPEMLHEFMEKYQEGFQVVCGIKPKSKENILMANLRRFYYRLLSQVSDVKQIRNFTGFGLYDKKVIEAMKLFNDPYPYFRGMLAEIGFRRIEVPFVQEKRRFGKTKNNFFTLYDMAMTGFVNHTKLPLRIAVFFGFLQGFFSLMIAMAYLVYKLFNWDSFQIGTAPLIIGLFFLAGMQLFFIGIVGEYVGAVWTQVKHRPWVIVDEKLNFDK